MRSDRPDSSLVRWWSMTRRSPRAPLDRCQPIERADRRRTSPSLADPRGRRRGWTSGSRPGRASRPTAAAPPRRWGRSTDLLPHGPARNWFQSPSIDPSASASGFTWQTRTPLRGRGAWPPRQASGASSPPSRARSSSSTRPPSPSSGPPRTAGPAGRLQPGPGAPTPGADVPRADRSPAAVAFALSSPRASVYTHGPSGGRGYGDAVTVTNPLGDPSASGDLLGQDLPELLGDRLGRTPLGQPSVLRTVERQPRR